MEDEGKFLCAKDPEPDKWFPTSRGPYGEHQYFVAASVCAKCELRESCALAGLRNRETGVWGGIRMDRGKIILPLSLKNKESQILQKGAGNDR